MNENRWALVVGASRGLGLGLVAELQRRGWNGVATVRDRAGEDRVKALSAKTGGEILVEHLDINDDAGIAAMRRRLDDTSFDLVFVNAGIAPPEGHDVASASREEAANIFLTNAIAPLRLARAVVDRVRDGPGIVAFMSSGLGSVADKTDSYSDLYSASKAALNSLSRSFAASLGRQRITVLAVAPGWVRTDMGGPDAPLSVEVSVHGIVDVLESRAGTGRHGFVDYQGHEVAW
jgi:NAD(P)-dependent dehydrogenase (short-subunit alcohol dehydrogenase family)